MKTYFLNVDNSLTVSDTSAIKKDAFGNDVPQLRQWDLNAAQAKKQLADFPDMPPAIAAAILKA
jgi:hypothetical protein